MYIKLGTIKANRYYDNPNDFIILSEVPSSSMSFESPTRVRSLDELDIWFGKTYQEYQYLRELVELGITLYLYKPVDPGTLDTSQYLDKYLEGSTPFPTIDYLKEYIQGQENIRYHSGDGIWIFHSGSWIRERDLIAEKPSESILNRDTLVLLENGNFCHPKYFPEDDKIFETPEALGNIVYSEGPGIYATRFSWSGDSIKDGEYLGFKSSSGQWIICYKGKESEIKDKFGRNNIIYKKINSFSDLINTIEGDYSFGKAISEKEYLIFSETRRELISMNSISSVSISWAIEAEESLLYSNILKSGEGAVSFWSRTIGKDSNEYDIDESRIKISIEDALEDGYIIRISRYGYTEYYIGHLIGTPEDEGIFDKINKNSKLVYCSADNINKLPEGDFYLDGAKVETPSAGWYRKSMDMLVGGTLEDSIIPDFFMIPDLSLYGEREDEQIFLPYATAGNFQYLISETSEEEYTKNYLEDQENRLLYFYGEIQYLLYSRPAYYVYLRCLLENSHGYQAEDIIYNSGNNPYIEKEELERYKCNYLVSNNQVYYYNKYQNGENYITSGLMRFIMGKVYREIQKRRWEIIGQRFNTLIENKINEIVQSVTIFSNVKSIQISNYFPYPELGSLDIEVDIWTRELLQNNVTLDITINYKKYGN